jgi:hypothetical protein
VGLEEARPLRLQRHDWHHKAGRDEEGEDDTEAEEDEPQQIEQA